MLVARAPVRISFAGGGTDLAAYYDAHEGRVVSTAIDKHIYVHANAHDGGVIQIMSSDYRTFYRHPASEPLLWDGDLALPRAVLSHFGIRSGLSLFLASQIPPGTGLGSSSAVCVALVKAASTLLGLHLSKAEIAEVACTLEIEKIGMPIGKQDQYASAFGGLNAITFTRDGVVVEPVRISNDDFAALERRILLFFTGAARESSRILSQQRASSEARDPQVLASLHAIKAMAAAAQWALERGDLDALGELLDASWQQKKRLASGITNAAIDECYEAARARGAVGGKITGAGGGGFLMLYAREAHAPAITEALEAMGLRRMEFRFDLDGAKVLTNNGMRLRRAVGV